MQARLLFSSIQSLPFRGDCVEHPTILDRLVAEAFSFIDVGLKKIEGIKCSNKKGNPLS